ncbi:MAG: nicotinate (nicotinamide) nucleotide adenylyltransferase [Balneolaceae bacterium]|nr:nicotinate (nicotinamide) nucleotide adenylyltransferase [Balneolaceae bacterium]
MADRIGLLGGTFDPVHNGHVSIFRSFLNSDFIDELWILLTPDPPHKQGRNHSSYADRLNMLHLAVADIGNISVSTIENELPKPSFTIQTLRALKEKYSNKNFHYCIGGDSLSSFHLWKDYTSILQEVDLLVAERPDFNHSKISEDILKHTVTISHEPIRVSSTDIRERIKLGNSISDLVPQGVEDYILTKRLYQQ